MSYRRVTNVTRRVTIPVMLASVEAIFAACFRSFATLPNGALIETDEVSGVINDIPLPFFNGIGRTRLQSTASIDEAMQPYRERQRSFRWWISPSTQPAGLVDELRSRGFKHVYDSDGMAARLDSVRLDAPFPPGLDIRPVATTAALQEWAEILLTVFARPPQETALWVQAYSHLGFDGPWTHYLGFNDGKAVATASVLVKGALAGVYHVATVPDVRGRGYGAAMTLQTMRRAAEAGATDIALQASEMGAGVYRSLGFTKCCDLTLYDWRPA
ncbi:MAG TPA: GNAT family N-acetyltransferase [Thermoanaerobaculia bacterium]|nr:GNAT family N-acetyltransferase [Thermoanaerobaculia bacterium]